MWGEQVQSKDIQYIYFFDTNVINDLIFLFFIFIFFALSRFSIFTMFLYLQYLQCCNLVVTLRCMYFVYLYGNKK